MYCWCNFLNTMEVVGDNFYSEKGVYISICNKSIQLNYFVFIFISYLLPLDIIVDIIKTLFPNITIQVRYFILSVGAANCIS